MTKLYWWKRKQHPVRFEPTWFRKKPECLSAETSFRGISFGQMMLRHGKGGWSCCCWYSLHKIKRWNRVKEAGWKSLLFFGLIWSNLFCLYRHFGLRWSHGGGGLVVRSVGSCLKGPGFEPPNIFCRSTYTQKKNAGENGLIFKSIVLDL